MNKVNASCPRHANLDSQAPAKEAKSGTDCAKDPIRSLVEMFVGMVQSGRISKGQCPALRPVFLKPHGVAQALFRVLPDLPEELRVGIFAGSEYAAWVRFSSDTLPTLGDYLSTLGVSLKLFGISGSKAVGALSDTTFDFILQNFDVFFVDTAEDMCAFTRAGVVDGDYGSYLKAHPETAKLLDQMAKPVASALATPYWSGLPFAFGPNRYVKYKLEPTITVPPPASAPADPTYLAADFEQRLQTAEVTFRFMVQFRTDPEKMPLDQATVRWDESESPFTHIADLILPQQSVADRGQAEYGENLSFNIWRATEPHMPQGSLAEARRVVYEVSAKLRRDVNGIAVGEPADPRPSSINLPCKDLVIVRAAIHPAIGIARIGDSGKEYFVGPEVLHPAGEEPGFYRDGAGALKRQVARFHIYGYNAAGEVVRELTPSNADIEWTVHLANKKATWYQFQAALDITDAAAMTVSQRNKSVPDTERSKLVIDPGPRSISGTSTSGGKDHLFDTGKFKEIVVPLGEIRTDENGCLLVFGGKGVSGSPSGAPIFRPDDGNSFNNADDWYDDISDGPVTATVSINGSPIPVLPAWVAVAPPNYAPQIVGWRTLYDLLVDVYTKCGWMKLPEKPSFARDILPVLKRLSNLQWVNKGFATVFGKGCPLDFNDPALISKLAAVPDANTKRDPYGELRQVIFNSFRPASTQNGESLFFDIGLWPWIYGDSYGSFSTTSHNNNLPLPSVQQTLMRRWVAGEFIGDWDPLHTEPEKLVDVPLSNQPKVLDQASLHFCLADAFHPGCELTWPVRHASMYESPFRIRHRAVDEPEPSYGATLAQQQVLQPGGPLYAQGAGDLSRWMALPWQGDTAFCRSGYDLEYDPYVPTFWPARVPNQVLTEKDYKTVMSADLPREERIAAYNQRASWIRAFKGSVVQTMLQMVAHFGSLGVVEPRPGFKDDPDFPETIYVESLAGSRLRVEATMAADLIANLDRPQTRLEQAGWESQEQLEEFRSVRIRHRN